MGFLWITGKSAGRLKTLVVDEQSRTTMLGKRSFRRPAPRCGILTFLSLAAQH
ncbi:hypothetical protein [Neisseria chenwenguii]|uniref:hypothetical protein n=1 Tax=Neisseria chenwenguii TaxID=1853278 RepID=UPI0012FDC305|nr:hypothetical protein [Neisseria chenwenguii]